MTTQIPLPVQRSVRSVSRVFGTQTAGLRMEPSFLIVGAQRCGTTSMYKTLSGHPLVLPAVLHKGVHFFDTNYDRGTHWYRGHFPLTVTAHRAERAAAHQLTGTAITGESSPYYMFHPLAPGRIAADLHGVRLVVLLRDPIERAHSAHAHESARGFESEPFERAIGLEQVRLRGEEARLASDPTYFSHAHQHNAYLSRGRYAGQLRRLEAAVGRERMCVIDSGDLFSSAGPILAALLDFLGLPAWEPPGFGRHNARPRSQIEPGLYRSLRAELEQDDADLAGWLGAPPSWRR